MAKALKMEMDLREFTETMQQYQEVSKKDEEVIVANRAGKLAFEFFKQFKKFAPTIALLKSLPNQLGYRIKRKFKGATVKSEINRRIRARFAAAAGWLPSVKRFTRSGATLQKIKNPKGSFQINLSEPSVTIINSMKEAVAAEEKHHIMQSAIVAQTQDMKVYINRKLEQRARQFSAK